MGGLLGRHEAGGTVPRRTLYITALALVSLWLLSTQAMPGSALFTNTTSVGSNAFATGSVFGGDDAVATANSWTTGLTHTAGVGPDRLLVFVVGYENCSGDPGVSAVSYGGRSLTRADGASAGTSCFGRVEIWYLSEASLTLASNSTFTVTWGGSAPSNPMYSARTYKRVDQTTPVNATNTNWTNSATPNPITTAVSVDDGGMAVSGVIAGNSGSYTWNNSFVGGADQTSGSTVTMSSADKSVSTDGSETASASHTGPNRQAIVAVALNANNVEPANSWTTGLTHSAGTGANRLLVFAPGLEDCSPPTVSAVSWGGQSLTRIDGTVATSGGCSGRVELWYLNEAGIQAASGNTFIVTWSGGPPSAPAYAAITYKNVSQTTPIATSATAVGTSTPNPITRSVSAVDRSMVVSAAVAGNNGSYTWNNGFSERTDQTSAATMTMSTADKIATSDTTETASATHSGPNRQAIVVAVLNPD